MIWKYTWILHVVPNNASDVNIPRECSDVYELGPVTTQEFYGDGRKIIHSVMILKITVIYHTEVNNNDIRSISCK